MQLLEHHLLGHRVHHRAALDAVEFDDAAEILLGSLPGVLGGDGLERAGVEQVSGSRGGKQEQGEGEHAGSLPPIYR